jgi:ABC-type uncharacterized transport system auxiliary subunit
MKKYASSIIIPSIIALLLLSSCALSPDIPQSRYQIEPSLVTANLHIQNTPGRGVIRVAQPRAVPGLDTETIQIKTQDGALTTVKNAVWIGPPAKMLEPVFIRGMETSGLFSGVIDSRSPAIAAYNMETNIEKFTIIEATPREPLHVEVAVRFTLTHIPENKLQSTRLVTVSEPVEALRMGLIIPAFEKAVGAALFDEIASFRTLPFLERKK